MIHTGVLEQVPKDEIDNPNCHYLAWFEVVTGTGTDGKGKFRIVYNAAGKINNLSLNDCLTAAPELTTSILNAAYKFRERKCVIMADVQKMFFQFGIPVEQRDYLRILIHEDLDPSKPLQVWRFRRIAFGLKPASMMASLGVQLCARDNLTNAPPHVTRSLIENLMMDDWVFTSDSIIKTGNAGVETIKLGESCKLNFVKFDSNFFEVLEMIPKERWAENAGPSSEPVEFKPPVTDNETLFTSEHKTQLLGTIWNKKDDILSIKVKVKVVGDITKRTCLSQQNSIFDTYGMVSSVTLIPKILIQKMHQLNIWWDDRIPEPLLKSWKSFMKELPLLSKVTIKRPIIKKPGALYTDIHIYSDSSNFAEGFVSYFRTVYEDEIDVVFAMGRSCIIPCKAQGNVQRLELDACLFSCEKINKVIQNLTFKLRNVYFWSDSQYCLRLINDVTLKLSVFEFNRINKIHMLAQNFIWCHVPGILNPSDPNTRGISPRELLSKKELLDGPINLHSKDPLRIIFPEKTARCSKHSTTSVHCGLCQCDIQYDKKKSKDSYDHQKFFRPIGSYDFLSLLEALHSRQYPNVDRVLVLIDFPHPPSKCKSVFSLSTHTTANKGANEPAYLNALYDQNILDLLEQDFEKQSWNDYVFTVAKFIKILTNDSKNRHEIISKSDLDFAKNAILGVAQRMSWKDLLPALKGCKNFRCPVDKKLDYKHLMQCSAFLDPTSNLIKCYGRFASVTGDFVSDSDLKKIVIPDKNVIIKKLILSIHYDLQHVGYVVVTGFLSRQFWLIRAQQYVFNILNNCIPCKTQKALCKKPEMSVLPKVRLKSFVVPFTNCGIDCCGPIRIKYQEGRNITRKAFILVLSCLSTRAVDFLLLRDMTSDSFLLALDTFNFRHNCPLKSVYCDQGSNFLGGANVLSLEEKECIKMLDFSLDSLQEKEKITEYYLKKNIEFNFGKSATPHQQGYVEVIVGIFKTMLYRVVGPFSETKTLTNVKHQDFELILAKLAYAINQRPLSPVSSNNNDLDFISPASFLKSPLPPHDPFVINDLKTFYSESRQLCNQYLKDLWKIWDELYIPSLYTRQKWYVPLKPFSVGDLILYKPKTKISKVFTVGRITKLIFGSDGINRHITVKTNEGKVITVPLHDVTRLECDTVDASTEVNVINDFTEI